MDNEEIRRDADVADQRPPGCTLTPATLVHVAHAHLRNSGEPAAVVFRNGRPVGAPEPLAPGDVFVVGSTSFAVSDPSRRPALDVSPSHVTVLAPAADER